MVLYRGTDITAVPRCRKEDKACSTQENYLSLKCLGLGLSQRKEKRCELKNTQTHKHINIDCSSGRRYPHLPTSLANQNKYSESIISQRNDCQKNLQVDQVQ